jgi:hypothetical protein
MTEQVEQWRKIPFAPLYDVSNLGRVRRFPDGRISAAGPNARGYRNVRLQVEGKGRCYYVHRIVAEVFLGPPPTEKHTQVAHNDGSRDNNRVENLRWATPPENSSDRLRHGTAHFGEANPHAKITDAAREEIKWSQEGCKVLSERYGLSQPAIVKIRGRLRAPNKRSRAEAMAHAHPPA